MTRLLLALALAASAAAQTPRVLGLQGRLEEAGSPLAGVADLTSRLYTQATSGTPLAEETDPVTLGAGGLFTARLGDTVALDPVDFAQPLYLGVAVDGGPELVPRLPLLPAPQALRVGRAGSAFPRRVTVSHSGDDAESGARLVQVVQGLSGASAAAPLQVFVGPGRFEVGLGISVPAHVHLRGGGRGVTTLESTVESSPVLSLLGGNHVSSLDLVGIDRGVYATSQRGFLIRDLSIELTPISSSGVARGMWLTGGDTRVEDVAVTVTHLQEGSVDGLTTDADPGQRHVFRRLRLRVEGNRATNFTVRGFVTGSTDSELVDVAGLDVQVVDPVADVAAVTVNGGEVRVRDAVLDVQGTAGSVAGYVNSGATLRLGAVRTLDAFTVIGGGTRCGSAMVDLDLTPLADIACP